MCGEQAVLSVCLPNMVGSPPRVRGTGYPPFPRYSWQGITPACAGNSLDKGAGLQVVEDHPRVCGEQRFPYAAMGQEQGSPPRVRGTALHRRYNSRHQGITPACAGNSQRPCLPAAGRRDHPRVCGEQTICTSQMMARSGSPPRVRGTAYAYPPWSGYTGITPACAGNRFSLITLRMKI